MLQTQMLIYTHAHSPLQIHACNPTSISTSERLSRQIIEIDEVTISTSLSTGTSLTTERIALVKFWNKYKKM